LFQRFDSSEVNLYYISYAEVGSGKSFPLIELPDNFFHPREKPQPVLHPIQ